MIDFLKLQIFAGDGGDGSISFRREKYVQKGGPDGGDGGDGGSVIIRSIRTLSTLGHLQNKLKIQAENGESGSKRNKHGRNGKDLIIEVPIGTRIVAIEENAVAQQRTRSFSRKAAHFFFKTQEYEDLRNQGNQNFDLDGKKREKSRELSLVKTEGVIYELTQDNQEIIVCAGGFGGRGNTHFKSSTQTTPRFAECGSVAERRVVNLELRLLADIGLVGQPNVGKSTLLSVLTEAKPKIANYPFTTLEPNLGVLHGFDLVIADIPGLVEDAHLGKGLGLGFIKHISHCRTLCFVLSAASTLLTRLHDGDYSCGWESLRSQLEMLTIELQHAPIDLAEKNKMIVITKADLYTKEFVRYLKEKLTKEYHDIPAFIISSATGEGVLKLKQSMSRLTQRHSRLVSAQQKDLTLEPPHRPQIEEQ